MDQHNARQTQAFVIVMFVLEGETQELCGNALMVALGIKFYLKGCKQRINTSGL
jgi:hypothetical protein